MNFIYALLIVFSFDRLFVKNEYDGRFFKYIEAYIDMEVPDAAKASELESDVSGNDAKDNDVSGGDVSDNAVSDSAVSDDDVSDDDVSGDDVSGDDVSDNDVSGVDVSRDDVSGDDVYVPPTVSLDVKNIYQKPELPNGCEVVSLTIVMNYEGIEADKLEMADDYLPKSKTLDEDPNVYYLRNPRSNGFYCYAGPIVKTVENYIEATGFTYIDVCDLTDCEPSDLYYYLEKGHPLVVWGTLLWYWPYKYDSGLYANLHCMVLSGVSEETVTITDPIYGIYDLEREKFEEIWTAMGKRAVTVSVNKVRYELWNLKMHREAGTPGIAMEQQ